MKHEIVPISHRFHTLCILYIYLYVCFYLMCTYISYIGIKYVYVLYLRMGKKNQKILCLFSVISIILLTLLEVTFPNMKRTSDDLFAYF